MQLTLYSWSEQWLYPYGYDYNEFPENVREIKKLAEKASQKMSEVHGVEFSTRNSAAMYPASGASDDWYKGHFFSDNKSFSKETKQNSVSFNFFFTYFTLCFGLSSIKITT